MFKRKPRAKLFRVVVDIPIPNDAIESAGNDFQTEDQIIDALIGHVVQIKSGAFDNAAMGIIRSAYYGGPV